MFQIVPDTFNKSVRHYFKKPMSLQVRANVKFAPIPL